MCDTNRRGPSTGDILSATEAFTAERARCAKGYQTLQGYWTLYVSVILY
jgi:hypothetical protein